MNPRRQAAALFEVLGVYLAGSLVVTLLIRLFPLHPTNPLATFSVGITNAELLRATGQLFVLLLLQYAGFFALIIPINWWQGKRGPAAYGLTRAGRSWLALLLAGLATGALVAGPAFSLNLANGFYHLGDTVPWRQAFFDTSWQRWQFWLFAAVGSYVVPAVLEELFYRGYCQRRLAEGWGDGAAIIGTSCLMVAGHSQYLIANAYNVGMIFSVLVIALGLGVVFAWTRSLIPGMVVHAIINVPLTPLWLGLVLVAVAIGAALIARRGAAIVREVFKGSKVAGCTGLALAGVAAAVASARLEALKFVGVAMVLAAIVVEAVEMRKERLSNSRVTEEPLSVS